MTFIVNNRAVHFDTWTVSWQTFDIFCSLLQGIRYQVLGFVVCEIHMYMYEYIFISICVCVKFKNKIQDSPRCLKYNNIIRCMAMAIENT